ncbi:MAG TPA: hypothetical protein VF269_06100 [Rhodanobacteraceae bacterium]
MPCIEIENDMSHIRTIRSVSIVLLLMCAAAPAVAQQYVVPTLQQLKNYRPEHLSPAIRQSLATHFRQSCLKQAMVCDHITIDFTSKDFGRKHDVVYITLSDKSAVDAWNKYRMEMIKHHHSRADMLHFSASIRVRGESAWKTINTNAKCPYCLPADALKFDDGHQYQVKFDALYRINPHPKHSFWGLAVLVARHNPRRHEPERYFIDVESKHGPTVYASVRTLGSHYLRSTAATGHFIVMLNSKYVQTYRPSYAVLSLLPSWRAFGHMYTDAEHLASAGSQNLPTFHGTPEQIVGAAVNYMKSLHIKSICPDIRDGGDMPHDTVFEILSSRTTSCAGSMTLLRALLHKSGVNSDPVLLNFNGMPPLSFSVPGPLFARHVILYIPVMEKFVDPLFAGSNRDIRLPLSQIKLTWKNGARLAFPGYVGFNTVTDSFMAVH